MKAFKVFIKPFEAPQRSVKINIQVDFLSLSGIGRERLRYQNYIKYIKITNKDTETLKYCCSIAFIVYLFWLTHFQLMFAFYIPWKQKTSGCLMLFQERNTTYWPEMG